MKNKKYLLIFALWLVSCLPCIAQYKVVVTNLNTKEEQELHVKDAFYFGTIHSKEVLKGTLDSVGQTFITLGNKNYMLNEITWIDFKGRKPKKNTSKISKVLFYFGAGLLGFSAYEYYQANDEKTAVVTAAIGAGFTLGALAFWILPKQPKFDFTTNYLLEILPIESPKIGTKE